MGRKPKQIFFTKEDKETLMFLFSNSFNSETPINTEAAKILYYLSLDYSPKKIISLLNTYPQKILRYKILYNEKGLDFVLNIKHGGKRSGSGKKSYFDGILYTGGSTQLSIPNVILAKTKTFIKKTLLSFYDSLISDHYHKLTESLETDFIDYDKLSKSVNIPEFDLIVKNFSKNPNHPLRIFVNKINKTKAIRFIKPSQK